MSRYVWTSKRVLIVDDMPKVVQRLTQLYESIGLEVVGSAVDGVDALRRIRELKPDLVSLDIIMPEMDGIECYRRIRDTPDFKDMRPAAFFMSYLATEPKILESYREEIPEHLFIAKSYTEEPVIVCLNRLYALESNTSEASASESI